ncbi:MAG: hypothetical protein ACI8Z1_000206 [Candidatus Azotimanducaceae bacterium]|jgi:hypothetical protein
MHTEPRSIITLDEIDYQQFEGYSVYRNLDILLETTHSLEQLLDTFFFEIQHWISSDGMCFSNEARNVYHEVGFDSRNKCHYRLYRGANYLGEICFSRKTRYNLDELELIEELVTMLIEPLQLSMAHHTKMI